MYGSSLNPKPKSSMTEFTSRQIVDAASGPISDHEASIIADRAGETGEFGDLWASPAVWSGDSTEFKAGRPWPHGSCAGVGIARWYGAWCS